MNTNDRIPCTRYDEEGVSHRVREVLAYACALSGGRISDLDIVQLHDHKGTLEVLWSSDASYHEFCCFVEHAWSEWGGEALVEHSVAVPMAGHVYCRHPRNTFIHGIHRCRRMEVREPLWLRDAVSVVCDA